MKNNTDLKSFNKKVFYALLVLVPLSAYSQLALKAYVSSNSVTMEEQFQYSVEISGTSTNLPEIDLPAFEHFFIISGPGTSTNIQFINGKSAASKTYTYMLQARNPGTYEIEKASANQAGKIIYSNIIEMTVSKDNAAVKSTDAKVKQSAAADIFLKSVVSKSRAFLGEQIIVEYKLYFKNQVRTYEVVQNPSATGFWKEDFDLPAQPIITKEIINGVSYNVAILKKMAIFPTRVGTLDLEPMVINVEAVIPNQRRTRQSLFDSFFEPSGRSVKQSVNSQGSTLTINSLPETGKPAGFAGAVGNFDLLVSTDKSATEVNEAVVLKIRLSGNGNIKLAELPLVEIPTDIEQYEPKISSNITKNNNRIGGFKQAEYILLPRLPGVFKIKPIQFSYFDPITKKYVKKSSGPISLSVTGEASAMANAPMAGFSRKEVTLLGRDIRFIKENTELKSIAGSNYFPAFLISGFLLGFTLLSGFLIYDDHKLKIAGNRVLAKSRSASKFATKLLSQAKLHLKKRESEAFYKSVSTALSRFVQDKLNIELTDFTLQTARENLNKNGLPEALINEYLDIISECDYKQFAIGQGSDIDLEQFMERSRKLITEMEKHI